MHFNERSNNDITIIDIFGEITIYNASNFKELITKIIKDNKKKIVLNFENVSFIDSSGIGALIFCRNLIYQNNGFLKITNLNKNVKKSFDATKLSSFISIYNNEEEALNSFNS